jgi:hypothetical protein
VSATVEAVDSPFQGTQALILFVRFSADSGSYILGITVLSHRLKVDTSPLKGRCRATSGANR